MEEFESRYCARANLLNARCWITAPPQQIFSRDVGSRSWISLPRLSMDDSTNRFEAGDRRPSWCSLSVANRKSLQTDDPKVELLWERRCRSRLGSGPLPIAKATRIEPLAKTRA